MIKNLEVGARTAPIIEELRSDLTQRRKALLVDKRLWDRSVSIEHQNIVGDSQHLPFADSIFGLLAEKDMFCAEGFVTNNQERMMEIERVGDILLIAQEWFRVLIPGGIALTIEVVTPSTDLFEKIDLAFCKAGFVRNESDLYKRGEISKLFKFGIFNPSHIFNSSNAFAITFHKPYF